MTNFDYCIFLKDQYISEFVSYFDNCNKICLTTNYKEIICAYLDPEH